MTTQKRGPKKFSRQLTFSLDYYNLNRLIIYQKSRGLSELPHSRVINHALREFFSKIEPEINQAALKLEDSD